MHVVPNTRLGWGQEGSMTQSTLGVPEGLEMEDRELMSIQELKMLMMQMTETQRMWGASARRQHSPGLAPRRSGDRASCSVRWGRRGFVCPCILQRET